MSAARPGEPARAAGPSRRSGHAAALVQGGPESADGASGSGLGLGALAIASLLIYRQSFMVIIVAAVVASIWELRGTLAHARGIQISWIPIVVGSAATIALAWPYGQAAQGIGVALTALACMVWRFGRGRGRLPRRCVGVDLRRRVPRTVRQLRHTDAGARLTAPGASSPS